MSGGDVAMASASASASGASEEASGTTMGQFGTVFGEEVLGAISQETREVLQEKWEAFVKNLDDENISKEKEDVLKEQKFCEVEHDLNLTRRRLEAQMGDCERKEKEVEELGGKLSQAKNKVLLLEETNSSLDVENGSLKRERDQLSGERNDLFALAERRQQELEQAREEWKGIATRLEEANASKCEALVKAEELQSREVSLEYREKRMKEEREFMELQVASLNEEISRKTEESIALRREQTSKLAQLQSKLGSKQEDVRTLEEKEEVLTEERDGLRKRVEELTEKLKSARDSEIKVEEHYRQELLAQTNLAQHYKSHCDESEKRASDLEKGVSELQSLVRKSEDRYGALEDNIEKEKAEHKEEIVRRNEAIRALKKELDDANQLVKTLKSKGLSPEGIEKLSPSAAAASKLLKTGMSLTQVFSQLVACQEELITAKDENKRLNTYLEQILKEIEERAPSLKQQREDYDRAVSAVNSLTSELEEARQEYELRKREAAEARRKMGSSERENARLTQQVRDLGKQVAVLVREVEASRSDRRPAMMSPPVQQQQQDLNQSDSEALISGRLLEFRSVSELQQKNIELLAVVRELSANREASESRLVEEKTAELQAELERSAAQLEELRSGRQRQEAMVESIIIERDMYKSIATNAQQQEQQRREQEQQQQQSIAPPAATSTPAVASMAGGEKVKTASPRTRHFSFQELEKRANQAEKELAEMRKDFDEYKEEKHKNDQIVNQELKEAKESLNEARTKAIKLSSQDEYNTERFKIAHSNAETYKKQAKLLEERGNKLSNIVAKHEETIEALRNEILASQSKLSQAEIMIQHLELEKSILKTAEARLLQEKEILHRQKSSSALVLENLNLVKLSLEKSEDEKAMRLRNRNEDLEKEVGLLRKKIDSEQDEFRESVRAWEKSTQDLRDKLEEAQKVEKERQEELATLNVKMEEIKQVLGETQEKLELAESTLSTRGVAAMARQDSAQPEAVSAKVRDLQLMLNQTKNEVMTLKEQLTNSREASNHYKEIADSAEKRLSESNDAAKALKDDLETRLKKAVQEKDTSEAKLAEIQESAKRDAGAVNFAEARAALEETRAQLERTTAELESVRKVAAERAAEVEEQVKGAREAQEKYERELMQHARDVESLMTLKATVSSTQAEVAEHSDARRAAEAARDALVTSSAAAEAANREEHERLREQFAVVEEENKSLHSQLSTVTQQMTSLQKHFEGDPDASRSFSEEESRSTEQLMQIIKYLRREKEILTSKIDVVQAESARIQSQMDQKERQLKEASAALKVEREKGSAAEISSSAKYTELMQKVQTMSALSESNAMLRDDKTRLDTELSGARREMDSVKSELVPLREKVRLSNEREETLRVEMQALRQENNTWKTRAQQLVEKQEKVNPEELKRLQNENTSLRSKCTTIQTNFSKAHNQANVMTAKVKENMQTIEAQKAEISQKQNEVLKATRNLETLKNNFQNRLNDFKAKVVEQETSSKAAQAERDSARQELEKERQGRHSDTIQHSGELQKVQEELGALRALLAQKEAEIAEKKKDIENKTTIVTKLRKLGRELRTKNDTATKELNELKAKGVAAVAGGDGSAAVEVVAEVRLELEELKTENERLDKEVNDNLTVIEEAHDKIGELEKKVVDTEKERTSLAESVDRLQAKEARFKEVLSKLRAQAQAGDTEGAKAMAAAEVEARMKKEAELEKFRKAAEAQMRALQEEKAELSRNSQRDREELEAKIEELEGKLGMSSSAAGAAAAVPAATPAVEKPTPETVSVKPQPAQTQQQQQQQAQQQQQRQKQALQAHIQPSLRTHPLATATIRPQRGVPRTGQSPSSSSSSSTEVPQVTVPPTVVSVSPNAAVQAMTAAPPATAAATSPSASALNVQAQEFTPMLTEAPVASSSVIPPSTSAAPFVAVATTSTAASLPPAVSSEARMITEQEQPQPGPSRMVEPPPAASAATPATIAAPKRQREDESAVGNVETKKARTEEEEDVVVLSSEGEEEEEQIPPEEEEDDDEEEVPAVVEPEEEEGEDEEEEEAMDNEEEEDVEDADEAQPDASEVVEDDDDNDSGQLRIAEGEEVEEVVEEVSMPAAEIGEEGEPQQQLEQEQQQQPQQQQQQSAAVPSFQSIQPEASTSAQGEVLEEQQDDGVVPGTPKASAAPPLSSLQVFMAAAAAAASTEQQSLPPPQQQMMQQSEAVPPGFLFTAAAASMAAPPPMVPDVAAAAPASATAAASAPPLDSTAVDFSQFAAHQQQLQQQQQQQQQLSPFATLPMGGSSGPSTLPPPDITSSVVAALSEAPPPPLAAAVPSMSAEPAVATEQPLQPPEGEAIQMGEPAEQEAAEPSTTSVLQQQQQQQQQQPTRVATSPPVGQVIQVLTTSTAPPQAPSLSMAQPGPSRGSAAPMPTRGGGAPPPQERRGRLSRTPIVWDQGGSSSGPSSSSFSVGSARGALAQQQPRGGGAPYLRGAMGAARPGARARRSRGRTFGRGGVQ